MKFEGIIWGIILLFSLFVVLSNAQGLVPAIFTFGDSSVDVGNNDYIATIFKADYPPYGRDFINHKPTGRFCNGKLATDITGMCFFTSCPHHFFSLFVLFLCFVHMPKHIVEN